MWQPVEEIVTGGVETLTVTGADPGSLSIDQGIGPVAAAGSQVVSPAATTIYTLTATGSGITKSQSVSVEVVLGLPVEFNFDDGTFQGWTDASRGDPGVIEQEEST